MVQIGPYKKFSLYDVVFFVFLLVLCIAGTVGFMWFAVGIENGNKIMTNFFKSLLKNSVGIIAALIFFNIFLAFIYSKKR
jgi:hypothetical protein